MPKYSTEAFEPHGPTVSAIVKHIQGGTLTPAELQLVDQRTPEEVDAALVVVRAAASPIHPQVEVKTRFLDEQGRLLFIVPETVQGLSDAERLEMDIAAAQQMGGVPLGAEYPRRQHELPQYISGGPSAPSAAQIDQERDAILDRYGPPIRVPHTAADWENVRAWQRYYRKGGAAPAAAESVVPLASDAKQVLQLPDEVVWDPTKGAWRTLDPHEFLARAARHEAEVRTNIREILLPMSVDSLSPQEATKVRNGLPSFVGDTLRARGTPADGRLVQRLAREVFDALRVPPSRRVSLAVKLLTREFGALTSDQELCRAGEDLGGLLAGHVITHEEADEILRRVAGIFSARLNEPWDIYAIREKYVVGPALDRAAYMHALASAQEMAIRLAAAAAVGALMGLATRAVFPLAAPGAATSTATALSATEAATFGGTTLAERAVLAKGLAEFATFEGLAGGTTLLSMQGLHPRQPASPERLPGETLEARDTRIILERIRRSAINLIVFTSMGPMGAATWLLALLLGD